MKGIQRKIYNRTLVIMLPDDGLPHIEFTGVWTPAMLERMMIKAQKQLRVDRVQKAREAEAARDQEIEEEGRALREARDADKTETETDEKQESEVA